MSDIVLTVPGSERYASVIRAALGGIAIAHDLSVDAMDDLRLAADEACSCLLHQGRQVIGICLRVRDVQDALTVSLEADYCGEVTAVCSEETAITKTVLETLIPEVSLSRLDCGCVHRIEMSMPKNARCPA